MVRKKPDREYKGYTVEFYWNGKLYLSKVPKITSQFVGASKSKTESFNEAKEFIDRHG